MRRTTIALAALTFACNSRSSGEQICVRSAEAFCDFHFDCCNEAERAELLWNRSFSDEELLHVDGEFSRGRCIEVRTDVCRENFLRTDASEEAGRLTLDRAVFDACFEPIEKVVEACDSMAFAQGVPNEACGDLFVGTIVDLEACYVSEDCATAGATCVDPAVFDQNPNPEAPRVVTLRGVCSPPTPIGAECNPQQPCAPGSRCQRRDNVNICVAFAKAGEACDETMCGDNLYCRNADGARTCARFLSVGSACTLSDRCRDAFCNPETMKCEGGANDVIIDYCKGESS